MDEDLIFTKRFLDCVKKPHSERTEQVSAQCVCRASVSGVGGVHSLRVWEVGGGMERSLGCGVEECESVGAHVLSVQVLGQIMGWQTAPPPPPGQEVGWVL